MQQRVVPSQIVEYIDDHLPKASQEFRQRTEHNANTTVWFTFKDHVELLRALELLLVRLPEHLLILPHKEYSAFTVARSSLTQALNSWRIEHGDLRPQTLEPLKAGPYSGWNPVTVIYELLSMCPDASPSPHVKELPFIEDTALVEVLRRDMDEVDRALAAGQWKSATVVAGSVVEALLLWALQKTGEKEAHNAAGRLKIDVTTDLNEWRLYPLLRIAE